MVMHPTKLIPVLALLLITAVALAQDPSASLEPLVNPGIRPSILYDDCYPNACVRPLLPNHWPFVGAPPLALVAIGSPAFGDYYNLTNQLLYLGVFLNPPVSRWFGRPIIPGNIRSGLGNLTTGIGVGFTALGEFVATLDNGVGGGLALARYNTATSDLEKTELWATKDISFIRPADWINGWTLSANLTIKDDSNGINYWIFLHAFAVYSNRTHAGGGRGVALNLTTAPYGTPPSYPPTRWRLLPFTSGDIKPFTIVYDSPRLLIATGGVMKTVDLSILDPILLGAEVTIDVNFTLIFPKAWPYAIVYYNYSITVSMASKLLSFPMFLNSTAFSIRFEIDQVNGAPTSVGSYNATIFTLNSCGNVGYNLLLATPFATAFRNITMFAAVYPNATEFTPLKLSKLVPYRFNNFDIVLPTGYQRRTLASEGGLPGSIPYVILQWSSGRLDYASVAGTPATYRNGTMFVYGYAYNVTNWVAANSPDPYIRALVERTVLHLPTYTFGGTSACGHFHQFRLGVAGSMADPTDVLALSYPVRFFLYTSGWAWFGLDVAPGAFQNLYTGSSTTGMAGFIGLRNFGGLPVVLARRSGTFPYFYDSYNRFALNKTYMLNTLRVMPEFNPSTTLVYRYATLTVGGPVVNMFTRYTQDFAWYAPFIHDYMSAPFPFAFSSYYMAHSPYIGSLFTTVWNSMRLFTANNTWPPVTNVPTVGYAIISTAVDPNGTVIVQIWGANSQDTYYAAKLLYDRPVDFNTAPVHIVVFTYRYNWPYPYNPPPHFVTADVYKLSPIMRPELLNTYRLVRVLGPPAIIRFEP
mgnify:CR=1 FL=1|jgi:hypothetical protein